MMGTTTLAAGTLLPGFVGTTLPGWLAVRLRAGLGGVCLFGPNIESPTQLRSLTNAVYAENAQAIIALDEEGGDVTRLFADVGSLSPGNAVLGRIDDRRTTEHAAAEIGWALRRAGANVNFAPSVDINSYSDNPVIGVRSFGAEALQVARHSAAWVTGLQSTGVAATAKHFPGHGDTSQDSHLALPVVDRSLDELRRRELVPFLAAFGAGARLVMTSHIRLPQVDPDNPATMSHAVLTDLLRGELGFTGVVVSDALDMAGAHSQGGMGESAVRALGAGCDLLCLGTETTEAAVAAIAEAVRQAVANGSLALTRVRDAAARVVALAHELRQGRPPVPDTAPATGSAGDLGAVVRSFDVSESSLAHWRTRLSGRHVVVRLGAKPNLATGPTPWGPYAAVASDPSSPTSTAFAAHPQFTVTGEGSALPAAEVEQPVLVLGRDIHRHAFARAAVDRLRAEHAQVLVVDMGWPSQDRRYADVATFGSSRLIGQALLTFLDGVAAPSHSRL